jgi:tetratricopeptide (TPR) repeat protein
MFVRYRRDAAEAEGNRALLAVSGGTTPTSSAYLDVAHQHAGTRAAERANLLAAGLLFTEGKPAEARALFDKVAADAPTGPSAAVALLGVASSWSAEGKSPEALAAYQRVIAEFPGDVSANRARLAKARLHEAAGQPAQALALYEEVARDPISGMAVQSAFQARTQLLQKHPELVKPAATNAMKAPSFPAAPAK